MENEEWKIMEFVFGSYSRLLPPMQAHFGIIKTLGRTIRHSDIFSQPVQAVYKN